MAMRRVKTGLLLTAATCLFVGCNGESRQSPAVTPAAPAATADERFRTGERLFRQNCSPCHPDGGNVTDPQRTLHGSDLRKHHITRPEDIVRVMRHPISRMIRFDAETLSDADAMAIAGYVMAAFKD